MCILQWLSEDYVFNLFSFSFFTFIYLFYVMVLDLGKIRRKFSGELFGVKER